MRGFETVLALLLLSTLMTLVARRVKLPAPVIMVLGGLVAALVPGMPRVELDPDLAFTIFVPPLLFRAATTTSLRSLKSNARTLLLLAVGLIAATTVGVGFIAHWWLPELPLASAFVLGAIVSPPDALVGISLARALKVPKRLLGLVEGETLLNDAAAFVIYRQTVLAARSGSFSFAQAGPRFLLVVIGGAMIGIMVGLFVRYTRKYVANSTIENVVWLFVPFAAFLPAEAVGVSGVLGVVVAGLLLRWFAPREFPARTREQAKAVYDVVEFILNGLIFILIGLKLGAILREQHGPALTYLGRATLVVTAAVILIRIAWIFPSAYLPHLFPSVRKKESRPRPGAVFLLSWMGVRGGDSLVTALAVPFTIDSGAPFPGRDLVVAVTFGVILTTLLFHGLTLAPLIRWLKLPRDNSIYREEHVATSAMREAEAVKLDELVAQSPQPNPMLEHIRGVRAQNEKLESDARRAGPQAIAELRRIELALIGARREAAIKLRDEAVVDDEVLRDIEHDLDLEELSLPDVD